ncbi:hypothetical protein NSK_006010 [Nannochloropsis salina CCMP1776]|uniref:Plastid lipid-associated protein/fibrillin conserved domain-containing protein n=1 Tax=Nannochloropsis salina CCMP1776 TaxID=1027361 RepID=A0A4D9CVH1_9STRA|nr:hypothetical protein NSK_006010 [Nannochloropsis salina CCMP1776]|eukprot:TFJ82584.1 hypothetical protein NSK_006010 [Nannochloropsis salina CCMP1776]
MRAGSLLKAGLSTVALAQAFRPLSPPANRIPTPHIRLPASSLGPCTSPPSAPVFTPPLFAAASDSSDWPSDSSDDDYTDRGDASSSGPDVVDATARATTRKELQHDLLLLLVGQNKGFSVSESEREDIDDTLRDLEAVNPTPRPTEAFSQGTSPLSGTWRLVYTDALDVLVLGLVPLAVIGKVFQNISPDGKSIANVVEVSQGASQLSFFPLLGKLGDSTARLRVEATSEILSPTRLSLTFQSAGFEPVTLFGMEVEQQLRVPKVDFWRSPNVGWIETTYVDEKIRIGRSPGGLGGQGSVFVFVREGGAGMWGAMESTR